MKKDMQNQFMDMFLNELLKVATERIKEMKPWEELEKNKPATVGKEDAAKYIGVSESTVNTLLKDNKIPCIRPTGPGGKIYFRLKTLDQWMTTLEEDSLKSIDDLAIGNGFEYKVS